MTTRTHYHQIAAQLDYAKVEQRLVQLQNQPPPKLHKSSADVLAPVMVKLRKLRANGWSYAQLAKELSDAGLPIKPTRLRQHLSKSTKRRLPKVGTVLQME